MVPLKDVNLVASTYSTVIGKGEKNHLVAISFGVCKVLVSDFFNDNSRKRRKEKIIVRRHQLKSSV